VARNFHGRRERNRKFTSSREPKNPAKDVRRRSGRLRLWRKSRWRNWSVEAIAAAPMGRYSCVPCAHAKPPARSIHSANPIFENRSLDPSRLINIPAVSDAGDGHHCDLVVDHINDAIIPDADAPEILVTVEFPATGRSRIGGQAIDLRRQPRDEGVAQILQFLPDSVVMSQTASR
jgi:hypothetical protein